MIVGIDLGTTHSLIGRVVGGVSALIPNALGSVLTPSVVGVDDNGDILVGEVAKERLVTHPQATVASFKRWMGSDRVTSLGEHAFRPEELSALVLRSLVADAEAATGEQISEAVVSVPAYFSDAQRKATVAAGRLAGIRVERLINEPTAAAIAYGLARRGEEGRFLVFDLGGGTFDVSILEAFDNVFEVHASAGDSYLGGDDFLQLLIAAFAGETQLDLASASAADLARLRRRLEKLKMDLSSADRCELEIQLGGKSYTWQISQSRFEEIAAPLLTRIRTPLERVLRDANLRSSDLMKIVLVGGATRMPMVPRLVARLFGQMPLRHLRPDEVVAQGAALAAALRERQEEVRELVLTDVCPFSLGVEVSEPDGAGGREEGLFSPIIERNTVVPTSRVRNYSPVYDYQQCIDLKIYQGESRRVAHNILLGDLKLPLPRAKRHELSTDVRFTYDSNGILEIEATLLPAGRLYRRVIESHGGALRPEEVEERLAAMAALKIHPRDEQPNRQALARAERLFEERLGDERMAISQWIGAFRQALESQDRVRVERARAQLVALLDQIEEPVLP
ncbi:MAG TPA: molecular chaperone HscC [Thermoanaerobaculia bacterium]|nr:molecular chaperone HscC [Thermoanaerobaculia bacterium]